MPIFSLNHDNHNHHNGNLTGASCNCNIVYLSPHESTNPNSSPLPGAP